MTVRFLILFLLLPFVLNAALIDSVTIISNETVGRYELVEIGISSSDFMPSKRLNVYDAEDVELYGIFTGPGGQQIRRDAFWYVALHRCNNCENTVVLSGTDTCRGWRDTTERLHPGDPEAYLKRVENPFPWRIRFAPPAEGRWTCRIYAKKKRRTAISRELQFVATPSTHRGPVRVAPGKRYLSYRERPEEPFIPLGINSVKYKYEDTVYNRVAMSMTTAMMQRMGQYGGNLVRIMMSPENFSIEWGAHAQGDGPGVYETRQFQAADLDSVFRSAEAHQVYIQLVLMTQDEIHKSEWWEGHPYNRKANKGGFLRKKHQFFRHRKTIRYFKQRMRYIEARWGYSPYLFAMEPMQEVDGYGGEPNFWHGKQHPRIIDWFRDVMQFGKRLDSTRLFVVSTRNNASGRYRTPDHYSVFGIPEADIINDHHYSGDYNRNFQFHYGGQINRLQYPEKPFMLGEAGLSLGGAWIGHGNFADDAHFNIVDWHNALWATTFNGAAGPALYWTSVDQIIHPGRECWGGQYQYYRPLQIFLEGETIFNDQPVPIANPCRGRGPKDWIWYKTDASKAIDTLNDPCSCIKRVQNGDVRANPDYIPRGVSTTNDSLLEVFALKTATRVIGWVRNKGNNWYTLPHHAGGDPEDVAFITDLPKDERNVPVLEGESMEIHQLKPGRYKIDFYSAYPKYDIEPRQKGLEYGGIIPGWSRQIEVGSDGIARITIPAMRPVTQTSAPEAPDYGFKLTRL